MPTLKSKLPSYRLHKASGQAVVTLNHKDVYLGVHGTDESRENYRRVIEEWLANHQQLPAQGAHGTSRELMRYLTVAELFLSYWEFVKQYYRKNGQQTNEVDLIRRALKPMLELYGHQPVRSFGPLGPAVHV